MPRPRPERQLFSAAAAGQLQALCLTQKQLAAFIGKSEAQVSDYFTTNKWPQAEFPLILQFLAMGVSEKTEAAERYVIGWKRPYRPGGQMRMADEVAKLAPPPPTIEAGPLVCRLFAGGRRGAVFGISAQTIWPAPFRVVNEAEIAESLYAGMVNGAVVGFFLPTAERIHRLTEYYGFDSVPSVQRHLNGFAEFRDGYIERLRLAGDPTPEARAAQQTQLFLWDEFPLTPCGHTVTLMGEAFGHGRYELEVLVRGPGSYGEIGLLPHNPTHCDRLRRWMAKVLEVDSQVKPPNAERSHFAYHFRQRMYGYLD